MTCISCFLCSPVPWVLKGLLYHLVVSEGKYTDTNMYVTDSEGWWEKERGTAAWGGIELLLLLAVQHDVPSPESYGGLTDGLDVLGSSMVYWDQSSGRWRVANRSVYRKGSRDCQVWNRTLWD